MHSNETFAIVHGNDIDGLASAALIKRTTGLPVSNIFFVDYTRECSAYAIKSIERMAMRGCTVMLADFALNDSQIGAFGGFIKKLLARQCGVYWFDHHFWSYTAIKSVAQLCNKAVVGENSEACAAEIVRKELGENSKFSKKLCAIAHVADFHLRGSAGEQRLVEIYDKGISYCNTFPMQRRFIMLRSIVETLAEGKLSSAELEGYAAKFAALTKRWSAVLVKHSYARDGITIGFSKNISANDACEMLLRQGSADIALYVNISTGKCHLRSRHADVAHLAIRFGGGGHPHAASFEVNPSEYGNFATRKGEEKLIKRVEAALGAAH